MYIYIYRERDIHILYTHYIIIISIIMIITIVIIITVIIDICIYIYIERDIYTHYTYYIGGAPRRGEARKVFVVKLVMYS